MTVTAATLFPELEGPGDLTSLLERLAVGPTQMVEGLLEDAGPLCAPERRAVVAALRTRLQSVLQLPQPFAPFLLHAAGEQLLRFEERLLDTDDVGHVGTLVAHVAGHLTARLHDLSVRVLVARIRELSAAGALLGSTPRERYEDFVARSLTVDFERELADAFPLLVPLLRRAARQAVDHALSVLERLGADRPLLTSLNVAPGDPLVGLDLGAGDAHRGGQSVAVLTFASGARLVYKPRDLRVDAAFQRVLAVLATWGATDLRTCAVLPRQGYGWMEFVPTAAPADDAELPYFERVGQLTAVLYLLGARDMHHSNVVCDGISPVAIDLETLLHPAIEARTGEGTAPDASEVFEDSVLRIGLLPTMVGNGTGRAIDLGGVGYRDGELSPYKSLVIRNRGRDDMTLALERRRLEGREHAPTVRPDSADVRAVAAAAERGFARAAAVALHNRERLHALVSACFTGTTVRYIHNPTAHYSQLLRLVTHPLFNRDPVARGLALQRIGLSRADDDPRLCRSEIRDLMEGDVPYFCVAVDRLVVADSAGRPLGELLEEAPLVTALRRIGALDEAAVERQRRIVRLAFVAKLPRSADLTGTTAPARGASGRGPGRRTAIRLAEHIADDLVAHQLPGRSGAPATWIGPAIGTVPEDEAWHPGVLGTGLYHGSSGQALFLALLARLRGSSRYADAARRVLEPLACRVVVPDPPGADVEVVGAYAGSAGPLYALAVAGEALDDAALVAAAVRGLPHVGATLADCKEVDLVAGAAGVIAVALAVARRTTDDGDRAVCLGVAGAAAEHLVHVHPLARGGDDPIGYTGFAHGSAGVHPQLRRLAAQRPDERAAGWLRLADRLEAHTRARYDRTARDWYADGRSGRRSSGWCHGAPGIGLSRVAVLDAGLGGSRVLPGAEDELRRAAELILERGLGNNVTYCHGDTGNAEILGRVAQTLDDHRLRGATRDVVGQLVDDVLPRHIASGASRYAHTGCLMLGASGVGHFLLRQIEPLGVPSVLTLD